MYFIHICSSFTYLGNRKGVFTSVPVKKWPSMTIFKIYDFEYVTYTNTGLFKACTIHSSWDTEWDRQKFLSFWAIFALLYTPEKPGKSKFWKNEKSLETRHYPFINVYHKWWRSYDVYIYIYIYRCWDIRWTNRIYYHVGLLFAILTPFDNSKEKPFLEKNTCRYYHLTLVYQKWQSLWCRFLRYGVWWTKVYVIFNFLHFYPLTTPGK